MRLSWVQFLMLSTFLECLHNRKKESIIYESHPYHSCVLYWEDETRAKKILILATRFGHFFFFWKLHTFSLSKTRKMRRNVMRAEVMTFTFLPSLKSEAVSDIAHWLYGTQSVRIRTIWISEGSLSISKWSYFLLMLFFTLWI